MYGYDYTDRIDPAALLAPDAAGERCAVVFRYTTRPSWPKSITPIEAYELGKIRMPLACNFESTADRMKGAAAAGHADAVEQMGNLALLGIPYGAVRSWFSADWDVQPGEVAAVLDYLHAAADVLGGKARVGCYGGLRAVQAAADAGFAIWQTVAWSGGRWDPRAAARQTGQQRNVGGVVVDVNDIRNLSALGAWTGGDMQLTDLVTVTPGFAARYPDAGADGFGAGAQIPVSTLLLGAAIRAAHTDHQLTALATKLDTLAAVDVQQLAAALAPLLAQNATADQIAAAVVAHLAATFAKG